MVQKLFTALLCVFLSTPLALACPCGCGSSDFLFLEPGESFKYRLSYTHELGPLFYDRTGKSYELPSDTKEIETVGATAVFALKEKLSLSLQMDMKKNIGAEGASYGIGDPSIHILGSVYEKDLMDTFHLSLKSGGSLKLPFAQSRSSSGSLKVFSSGHWEFSPNFSASLQYRNWIFQTKEIISLRVHRSDEVSPDFVNRLSFGAAYTLFGLGQLGVNLDQELRWQEISSGRGLTRYTHKLRWALTARVGDRKSLNLSFQHPVIAQKNAPIYKEVGLSFSQAI